MKITVFIIYVLVLSGPLHSQKGWQYQNSNLSGNQYGAICAINKDTVCVIADKGKFLKTVNGGTTWATQNTGIKESFFDLSFINADTGYAVGQKGTIIRTRDGGAHWDSLATGTNKDLFSISTKTPANLWIVGDSGVILNSYDYGTTWIKNNALTGKKLNSIRFRNAQIGFIAGNSGTLFGTVNGGASWNTLTIATTKDLFSLSVTHGCAYLLAGGVGSYFSSGFELFRTNDNLHWVNANSDINGFGNSILYFQNDSLGYVVVSGCITSGQCFMKIFKTKNYGQNWMNSLLTQPVSTPGMSYSCIVFVKDSIGYAFSGNNILKTMDGGVFVNIEEHDNNSLKIYPNPAVNKLTIDNRQLTEGEIYVELYDLMGKQVVHEIKSMSPITEIDISGLSEGIYMVKIESTERMIVKKIVVER